MAKKILIDVGYAPIFIPGIWTFWSIHIDNPPAINDLGDLLDAEIIFGLGTPLIPFANRTPLTPRLACRVSLVCVPLLWGLPPPQVLTLMSLRRSSLMAPNSVRTGLAITTEPSLITHRRRACRCR